MSISSRILIIDNDTEWVNSLRAFLPKFNLEVTVIEKPDLALKEIKSTPPDFIVLDLMVPGQVGLQVLKQIRTIGDVPIIMVTERADTTDRVIGLEMGADDYVAKPIEPRELVARIQAILRRPRFIEKRKNIRVGDLEIQSRDRRAKLLGKTLELTTMEFEILALLASKPGNAFTRDQIMDHLRGEEYECFSRTIDVLLSRLRTKLKDDSKNPKYIKTVWGTGYAFMGKEGD